MLNNNKFNIQEAFLKALQKEQMPVSIFLSNGVKLHGVIDKFDEKVIMLKNNITQMVFKRAISTIVPEKNVTYDTEK